MEVERPKHKAMIKVGITQGDINGIGYEVILKTFADIRMAEICIPVIYGSAKVAAICRWYCKIFIQNGKRKADRSRYDT